MVFYDDDDGGLFFLRATNMDRSSNIKLMCGCVFVYNLKMRLLGINKFMYNTHEDDDIVWFPMYTTIIVVISSMKKVIMAKKLYFCKFLDLHEHMLRPPFSFLLEISARWLRR